MIRRRGTWKDPDITVAVDSKISPLLADVDDGSFREEVSKSVDVKPGTLKEVAVDGRLLMISGPDRLSRETEENWLNEEATVDSRPT